MAATGQDFAMWPGDTVTLAIPITDEAGAAVNLAGASAIWWVGATADTAYADGWVKKSTGAGATITLINNIWTLTIPLAPADTAAVKRGKYYHRAVVTDAGGAVETVETGRATFLPYP